MTGASGCRRCAIMTGSAQKADVIAEADQRGQSKPTMYR